MFDPVLDCTICLKSAFLPASSINRVRYPGRNVGRTIIERISQLIFIQLAHFELLYKFGIIILLLCVLWVCLYAFCPL